MCAAEAKAYQEQRWFKEARCSHPCVKSGINHLEHCGLDRVRDYGRHAFARAVALSVLVANIKQLGTILRDRERKRLAGRQRLHAA